MKYFPLLIFLLFINCQPAKTVSVASVSTPLPKSTIVDVIGGAQKIPDGAKFLGHISIVDGGLTLSKNCTYEKVVENAQSQARGLGGDLIQITKHKEPNLGSSCHRIWCDVYKK